MTPDNSKEWQVAKLEVESTFNSFCQAKIHLGGVHWVTTVYCLTFRRHLSTKHPLYAFFQAHCEGTVPHISASYGVLTEDDGSGNTYFTMGSKGFIKLSKQEFDERNYETFTVENLINVSSYSFLSISLILFLTIYQVISLTTLSILMLATA